MYILLTEWFYNVHIQKMSIYCQKANNSTGNRFPTHKLCLPCIQSNIHREEKCLK